VASCGCSCRKLTLLGLGGISTMPAVHQPLPLGSQLTLAGSLGFCRFERPELPKLFLALALGHPAIVWRDGGRQAV